MTNKRWSLEEATTMRCMAGWGVTTYHISEEMGCCFNQAHIMTQPGWTPSQYMDDAGRAMLGKLMHEGRSIHTLMKRYGLSSSHLYKIKREYVP